MKKLIATILVICIVLPCGSYISANASDSSDLSFMKAFGFIPSDVNAEDAVTRLELAKIYYAIAGVAFPSAYEPKFSDVSPEDAAVVNLVSDMGIMVGSGDGMFKPSENLTFAQFAKTIVTFLGYEAYAEKKGGYPYGYIVQAQSLDIIQSYPQNENDYVTYALVSSVFKLASGVRTAYILNDEYHADFDYLKRYKNINRLAGVVLADNVTDIGGAGISPDYDEVVIDSKLYSLTEESFSLKNHVGKSMQIYYDDDNNIIWYESYDNRSIKIDGENINSMSRSGSYIVVDYLEGDREKKLKVDNGSYVVYNGTVLDSFGDELFEIIDDESREVMVEAIDNDSDGNYEVLFIDAYKTYIAMTCANGTIYTKKSGIISIDGFEEGNIPILNITGKYLPFDSIAEGDVINVFEDFDGKVNKIVVTIDTYTGVVSELSYADRLIVLDENRFELSSSVSLREDYDKLKAGARIKAYFNMDGEVCDFELADKADQRLGYIIDGAENSQDLDIVYKLLIFSESGSVIEASFADKVTVNGDSKLSAKDAYALAGFTNGKINRQLIVYKTDSKTGEIAAIRYCSGTLPEDGLYMYEGFDGLSSRSAYPYKLSSMSFGGKLLVNSGTVVFSVPTDSNRSDTDLYQIKTVSIFQNDDVNTLFEAYGTQEYSPVADALVMKKNSKQSEDLDDNMILVDKISIKTDKNGDTVQSVRGICAGAVTEYIFAEGTLSGIEKGDVIFPSAKNANGVWENARLIFDKSENALNGSNPTGEFISDIRFCYGKVIIKGDGYISVEIESLNGNKTVEHFNTSKFKLSEFNLSVRDGEASVGSASRIFDSRYYDEAASYVLVHTRRGDAKSIVIYNEF